jgi:hypothetical protein
MMAWDIRVWHEEDEGRTRLVVEAGPEVPDDVISAVAGAYWLDEVQYGDEVWDEVEIEEPGPLHG